MTETVTDRFAAFLGVLTGCIGMLIGFYMGYVWGAKSKSEQCPAKWGNWVNGTWVFEGKANA